MLKKPKQAERTAALIREAIMAGKLHSHQRLIETELAERFGVSRTPIRAAIRELEESGWLKTEPNRGALVVNVTSKDVEELFVVRAVLESFAAGEVCTRIAEKDIELLWSINEQMDKHDPMDNDTLRLLNLRFHKQLCSLAGNTFLTQLIEQLWQKSEFFRRSVWYPPGRWRKSIEDHIAILTCLKQKDRKGVTQIMQQHITYSAGLIQEIESVY